MAKVIIAEKPSVAKNIAEAIGASKRGDGYYEGGGAYVTWAFGHLLELFDAKEYDEKMTGWRMDNFPFIPEPFQYKVKTDQYDRTKTDSGAQKQLDTIASLIARDDVNGVISACDFDREGQIIGDIILDFLHVQKPIKRLLLNEWTPTEVKAGLTKLVDNQTMSPLKDAGISRQWADWLIGINLTSVATLKYQRGSGKALNIGRVLMPTLKIIYDRDMEIEQFVPEEYHRLLFTLKNQANQSFEAVYIENEVERFENKAHLEGVQALVTKGKGTVESVQKEIKREYPPSLFNLSGLQGHITSKNKGWTSDRVLKVAQSLYEKKMITYPRTASLALEESLIPKAKKVLSVHQQGLPYAAEIQFHTQKRVFDNSKVESHSAIMPTYMVPGQLSAEERIVYEAVKNRFIMQFMPIAEHEETTVITRLHGLDGTDYEKGRAVSKGRVQLVEGWRKVEAVKTKEKSLPKIEDGEAVTVDKLKLETKGTQPPKRHTEKTLLRVMETCGRKLKNAKKKGAGASDASDSGDSDGDDADDHGGDGGDDEIGSGGEAVIEVEGIDVDHVESQEDKDEIQAILSGFSIGTPATRAETITKLIRVGYVAQKGKQLLCTPMGKKMVETFPVKALFDLEYTGRLEKNLSDIAKGDMLKVDFMTAIIGFTNEAVEKIKGDAFHVIQELKSDRVSTREVLGKCPTCGSDVVESEKAYGCSNYKGGCRFSIWKDDKFLESLKVKATKGTIVKLLEKGQVCSNQFVNKKGETFAACLSYQKKPDSIYYQWVMTFPS